MLTPELKQFIEGPQGMSMGTRDANLVPEYTRVLGAQVTDSGTLKFFVAKVSADRALSNVDDNGQVAITFANPPTFECYQIKGKAVNYRDSTTDEQNYVDHYMAIFDSEVQSIGVSAGAINIWPSKPMISIEIEVQAIFDQTPKIGAGNQINQVK